MIRIKNVTLADTWFGSLGIGASVGNVGSISSGVREDDFIEIPENPEVEAEVTEYIKGLASQKGIVLSDEHITEMVRACWITIWAMRQDIHDLYIHSPACLTPGDPLDGDLVCITTLALSFDLRKWYRKE